MHDGRRDKRRMRVIESRKKVHMRGREPDEVETVSKEEAHVCGIESKMRCVSVIERPRRQMGVLDSKESCACERETCAVGWKGGDS